MIKTKMSIVSTIEREIPRCPYCGGEPNVSVEIVQKDFQNDRISVQEVICPWCGLSAPIDVWDGICSKIDSPVSPDEDAMEDMNV